VNNITTRTTIVSNVQLDDNIQLYDCWKRKGLSRRRKLEVSTPKQRLRAVHSRSEVQKRWRSDYRL